jgi:hypothetical protein
MSDFVDAAPAFVTQGVHHDAVVYHPRVVDLLVEAGISRTSATVDSLVLMRVWKWNWIRDAAGETRRFAADDPSLPWVKLRYDDVAEQLSLSVGRVRDAIRRLQETGLLRHQIVGHPEHGSQKYYLVDWTTADSQHPGVRIPNTPPADSQHPYEGNTEDTNAYSLQALSSGSGGLPAVAAPDDEQEVTALCTLLADKVQDQRGSRPKVSAAWVRDMRLLLKRGPKHVDGPAPSPDDVATMVYAIFDRLSSPDRKGFCWADQIRSAGALRDHWDQCRVALSRTKPTTNDEDVTEMVRQMKAMGL